MEKEKKEYERIEKIDKIKMFGTELNVYGTFDKPWFLAKEVADWIEYNTFVNKEKGIRNVSMMIRNIKDKHKKKFIVVSDINEVDITYENKTRARNYQEMLFINESGLYKLLFTSKTKKAELFRDDICEIIQEMRIENRELVFNENSKKKNKEIKERGKEILFNKFYQSLMLSLVNVCNIDNKLYTVCDFINKFKLDMTEDELIENLKAHELLDKNGNVKKDAMFDKKIPMLIYYNDEILKFRELNFTLPGMIFIKALFNTASDLNDKELEYIYGKDYNKYFDNGKKKHKKNKKKDKKTIRLINYVDYLEEKEKHKDKIRHVKVRHIK